jgi:hypothetical protein
MGLKDGNVMRPISREAQYEINKFMKQFTNADGSISDKKYEDYMTSQKALVKLHKSNVDTFKIMSLKFARGRKRKKTKKREKKRRRITGKNKRVKN